jgi:DNA phosphorothioation-associated putative methyltransferase
MAFVTERGRLPSATELPSVPDILAEFRTLRRAFQVILQATDQEEWDAIADKRRQDLLVYLALTQFSRRPKISNLDTTTQNDIKALFGNYKQACTAADLMLVSVGNPRLMPTAANKAKSANSYLTLSISTLQPSKSSIPNCDSTKVAPAALSVA